jgi:hypothetical protein
LENVSAKARKPLASLFFVGLTFTPVLCILAGPAQATEIKQSKIVIKKVRIFMMLSMDP